MTTLQTAIHNMKNDVESAEHDYVVACLKAAIEHCKEQYEVSGGEIDIMPSVSEIRLTDEADKFTLLETFLRHL